MTTASPVSEYLPVVWVAGATGLIGRELLKALASPGPNGQPRAQVHALVRHKLPVTELAPVTQHVVDYTRPNWDIALPRPQAVYIALGTTIAVAGSQKAFKAVDFDAVLAVAQAAQEQGAKRCAVVSALGANSQSSVFYNRVKGDMEHALFRLAFERLVIARPSLLDGDRDALGQLSRRGERWTLRLLRPLLGFIPVGYRPIHAATVAQAMVNALSKPEGPIREVLESGTLQSLAESGR